jgi:hypothetical protein
LDLFEKSGFTVTHISTDYPTHCFTIAIKSESIIAWDDFEHETAKARDVVSLIENNGYRVESYRTGCWVKNEYEGTIYLEIGPELKITSE